MKAITAFLCFVACLCSAAEFELGTRGSLSLPIPSNWTIQKNEFFTTNGRVELRLVLEAPAPLKGRCRVYVRETIRTQPSAEVAEMVVKFQSALFRAFHAPGQSNIIRPMTVHSGYGAYTFSRVPPTSAFARETGCKWIGITSIVPNSYFYAYVQSEIDDPGGPESKAVFAMIQKMAVTLKGD